MAITVTQPSVGTTATLIASNTATDASEGDFRARTYRIKNITATAPVFLGGAATVTTANGYSWATADGPLVVDLEPGESLYGIVTTTAQVCHVLAVGR